MSASVNSFYLLYETVGTAWRNRMWAFSTTHHCGVSYWAALHKVTLIQIFEFQIIEFPHKNDLNCAHVRTQWCRVLHIQILNERTIYYLKWQIGLPCVVSIQFPFNVADPFGMMRTVYFSTVAMRQISELQRSSGSKQGDFACIRCPSCIHIARCYYITPHKAPWHDQKRCFWWRHLWWTSPSLQRLQ